MVMVTCCIVVRRAIHASCILSASIGSSIRKHSSRRALAVRYSQSRGWGCLVERANHLVWRGYRGHECVGLHRAWIPIDQERHSMAEGGLQHQRVHGQGRRKVPSGGDGTGCKVRFYRARLRSIVAFYERHRSKCCRKVGSGRGLRVMKREFDMKALS